MRKRNVVFSIVVFALSPFCASNETPAQNSKINFAKENAKSNSFKEGETVIAAVEFAGLDTDCETYDGQIEKPVCESELSRILREGRATISADEKFNSVKVEKVIKLLKEWLAGRGYLKAEVVAFGEKLPKNQMRLFFSVRRGVIVRVSEIRFAGNVNVASEELVENFKSCVGGAFGIFNRRFYEYCAQKHSLSLMFSRGYFKARIEQISPRLVSDNYV
ncbi:MAG: hypothetical protein M3033_01650, partial [Acidobacteriota bacterium]|nr:hypothetical protein [Acidobacteriota bacterium]